MSVGRAPARPTLLVACARSCPAPAAAVSRGLTVSGRGRRACWRRSRGTRRAAGSERRTRTAGLVSTGCAPGRRPTATRSGPARRSPPSRRRPWARCPAPPCGDTPPLSARVAASESMRSGQPGLGAANRFAAIANETWSATRQDPAGTSADTLGGLAGTCAGASSRASMPAMAKITTATAAARTRRASLAPGPWPVPLDQAGEAAARRRRRRSPATARGSPGSGRRTPSSP